MVQILGKEVGETGYGLMGFTWRTDPIPNEEAYVTMKAAVEAGSVFWNGGDFYGPSHHNSLHLLAGYFTKYPEDAEKVVLSIKSGCHFKPDGSANFDFDGTPEYVRDRVNNALAILDGKKKIDVFEYARTPKNVDFFDVTLRELAKCVDEGLIGGIGLSEVSAETIRKAGSITKIAGVEVKLSPWASGILHNGVAEACAEVGTPVIAYSPVASGMLAGQLKSVEDIPKGDPRGAFIPAFAPDNIKENLKIALRLQALAKDGVTLSQLSIAWVRQIGKTVKGNPQILPIPGTTVTERVKENSKLVTLDEETMAAINEFIESNPLAGRLELAH